MDVDLLRPGIVPISPHTKLWFEFLLDPDILLEHLKRPFADPAPLDLLMKFLDFSVEPDVGKLPDQPVRFAGNFQCSRRKVAAKIVALKIFAYWKWNLDMIEMKIPLQMQFALMDDFLRLTDAVDKDHVFFEVNDQGESEVEKLRDEQLFSLALYHRWIIRTIVGHHMINKNILIVVSQNFVSPDEIMTKLMGSECRSETILKKIVELNRKTMIFPTYNSFMPSAEDGDYTVNFDQGLQLPVEKLFAQIYFDLGMHKLYREMHDQVASYFNKCKELLEKISDIGGDYPEYCKVDEKKLDGFCRTCTVVSSNKQNLSWQFYRSLRNNYANIFNILAADNTKREIPITFRDSLELELASTLANGKFTASRDLLFQIQTLNAIRRVLDSVPYPCATEYAVKLNGARKGADILLKALKPMIKTLNEVETSKLRMFLLILFDTCDSIIIRAITSDKEIHSLLSSDDLEELDVVLNKTCVGNEYQSDEKAMKRIRQIGNPQLEISVLEREIIKTYSPIKLKELIQKFAAVNNSRPITAINKYNWDVSKEIVDFIDTLPNQFLQQYCFVAMAKMSELVGLKNYNMALEYIRVIDEELRAHPCVPNDKFAQLLSWETLYINMMELQTLWPAKNLNYATLIMTCKSFISSIIQDGLIVTRTQQIAEQCLFTFLNLGEWEYLLENLQKWEYVFQKRVRFIEIAGMLSCSCIDVVKFKGTKKFPKDIWDIVTSAFNNNPSGLRLGKLAFSYFISRLRDATALNVMLSLVTRFYNVLLDEPNVELYFHYTQLWPSAVTNPNSYDSKWVFEILWETIDQTCKYHPYNIQWLKLYGDLNFVRDHHAIALKYYLQALIVASDYFARPASKSLFEDFVYKRMIKCCMALGSFTQAAVLCQLLDEVDYTTAYKCLSETASSDSMDNYYQCFWDVNILEYLIYVHSKRGEYGKRNLAIEKIGLLELNSNNNDEIKREACNSRKLKFLRALAKQYII